MFRRVLLASAGAVVLAGAAQAADLTRPPPPPVYIPPPTIWTGLYVRVDAGGTWSSNNGQHNRFSGPLRPRVRRLCRSAKLQRYQRPSGDVFRES